MQHDLGKLTSLPREDVKSSPWAWRVSNPNKAGCETRSQLVLCMQVCSNVFDTSTDWNISGAEQLYTVNPATGDITTESRRRALLASNALGFTSRALLGGSTGATAAANEPVSLLNSKVIEAQIEMSAKIGQKCGEKLENRETRRTIRRIKAKA